MEIRRITANLPADLLEKAQAATGQGITETLVEGLQAILRKSALEKAKRLQGKILLAEDEGRHGPAGK
jgi:hypothetical protein